jgi:integrase
MRHTFKLKDPKCKGETLIYFRVYFKDLNKSFIYSTGEKITPEYWDFKNHKPLNLSSNKSDSEIRRNTYTQLTRYSDLFNKLESRYKIVGEKLTIDRLKAEFDQEFKRQSRGTNDFFRIYDLFLKSKEEDRTSLANSLSTIKRYVYNKKLLEDFEKQSKKTIRFTNINKEFYNSFVAFCIDHKKHSTNTLSRNVGLLKTFLNWAVYNHFTYNLDFKKFPSIQRFITTEVALTIEQVQFIYDFDLTNEKRLEKVRDLFVFGCVTGMRYSNYSEVRKMDIEDNFIRVIDFKDKSKKLSIPLNKFSTEILEKYEYQLPKISNQKFNKYLKELFRIMDFQNEVKKSMKYGNEVIDSIDKFYERISSHTARRSFITIMKNKNVPDKVIMSFTGHKSISVFNDYYRPNEEQKINFMNKIWG